METPVTMPPDPLALLRSRACPAGLGFHSEPLWWPIPPLVLAGILVSLTIRYLPGTGGHSPADGFKAGAGAPAPAELPGIILAALATLSLGVVLGPEAYVASARMMPPEIPAADAPSGSEQAPSAGQAPAAPHAEQAPATAQAPALPPPVSRAGI